MAATQINKQRNVHLLRGGSPNSDFFKTYYSFEDIEVQKESDKMAKQVKEDSPINMLHIENSCNDQCKALMPQYRFLFSSPEALKTVIRLMYRTIKVHGASQSEKDKMRAGMLKMFKSFM